jgi:hypothetical protein
MGEHQGEEHDRKKQGPFDRSGHSYISFVLDGRLAPPALPEEIRESAKAGFCSRGHRRPAISALRPANLDPMIGAFV